MIFIGISNIIEKTDTGYVVDGVNITFYEWKKLKFSEKDILTARKRDGGIFFHISNETLKRLKEFRKEN